MDNIFHDMNLKHLDISPYGYTSSADFINDLELTNLSEQEHKSYVKVLGHYIYTFKLKYNEPSAIKSKAIYTGVWFIRKRVQDFKMIVPIAKSIRIFDSKNH